MSRARKIVCIIAAVPIGLFLLLLQIGMFGAHGFWEGTAWLAFQLVVAACIVLPIRYDKRNMARADRIRREAETAARADYEHSRLMDGDWETGVHGAYLPYV